jgi:Uma2 family endonuclease
MVMAPTPFPEDPRKGPPAVDLRLVAPESRYEIQDGKIEYVPVSDEPHGTRHSKLSALLEAHVAEAWDVATDMLTRTSEIDDIAPDASVFRREWDPETGDATSRSWPSRW